MTDHYWGSALRPDDAPEPVVAESAVQRQVADLSERVAVLEAFLGEALRHAAAHPKRWAS